MEPTGMKHWSQGSTPGDMNDFDVHVVFTWPTGKSTHDMVCSFGFVSFGRAIDLFWPVDSTPMLLEEQCSTVEKGKKWIWKLGKNKHATV